MKKEGQVELLQPKAGSIKSLTGEGYGLPPRSFKHHDLISTIENAHLIDRETLINTLNHIHFTDGHVHVLLQHPKYKERILVHANIEPGQDSKITCRWAEKGSSGLRLEKFQSLYLIIDDGQSVILIPTELQKINRESLTTRIPDHSYALGQRQIKRHVCRDVIAELNQTAFQAKGELLDFSPIALRVKVRPVSSSSFKWFNSDELINIQLRDDQKILFSGSGRCLRQRDDLPFKEMVLTPLNSEIKRFKKRNIRNQRQKIIPTPTVIFHHPLLGKRIQREIHDISTSGFSLYEEFEDRVLMPSMIIQDLTICFASALKMNCTAQVIYRIKEEAKVRCGLVILDMDIQTYSHLTQLLKNTLDPHCHISTEVDMDALWKFFFDSGFIYPKKYDLIRSHRGSFKETYRKIYQENSKIAKHFTYQKNGHIYGHIAMVRAYDRAWMIHHHAALDMDGKHTGLRVLKQIVYYLIDMLRLPSAMMDYVVCYFRPDSRFPSRIFGSFARDLKNPQRCSMDLFSYLPYTSLSLHTRLPTGYTLEECSELDFWELTRFYNHFSGGLFLNALGLNVKDPADPPLETLYEEAGLYRKLKIFSLSSNGELDAVLIVDQSDLGFNLSELLNSIKVIVTNPEKLPWNVLSLAIAQLTSEYNMKKVPILFYPSSYVDAKKIPFEKQYQLWVLNVQNADQYMEYLQKTFRMK
ncbi:MAG TPA: PilZ domain-containing protein [Desulfobacterales bacterium]|nr:PilZ domain-containing protein [Desulfobacterales bacterium]